MSGFEFAFTLFGLLLGLALTEGLRGLASAIKTRHLAQIGWSTACLGLFVACDAVTFWMYGWAMREKLVISWPLMFGGFIVTGTYYICAALVFPEADDTDSNAHFDRVRRIVIGGILASNVVLLSLTVMLIKIADPTSLRVIVITWSFFPLALLGMLTSNRKVATGCLICLIALYPLSVVWN